MEEVEDRVTTNGLSLVGSIDREAKPFKGPFALCLRV